VIHSNRSPVLVLLGLALLTPRAGAVVLRVSAAAPGPTHDGLTWDTAFLAPADAVAAAQAGDEVWVAGGVYVRRPSLTLKEQVSLYGGFAGTETARDQRDPSLHPAILDGDGYSAVFAPRDITHETVLDGFTIRNGDTGVVCYGSPTISHNIITGQRNRGIVCDMGGSAIIVGNTITNCGNKGSDGAGIFCETTSSPLIVRNVIVGNTAMIGGGIRLHGGIARLYGNLIAGNKALSGGGVYAYKATLEMVNNTVAENASCGLYLYGVTATLANNVIAFNEDAGLATDPDPIIVSTWTLRSNVVFGNTQDYFGLPDPTGTDGNLRADPQFVNRQAGDYRLCATSPLIDAGDDMYVSEGDTDLDGLPRIAGEHVDIGAYEFAYGPATLGDACGALRVWAGLSDLTPELRARLEAAGGTPFGDVDLATAIVLLKDAVS